MGVFSRFRDDVQRVGATLAPILGGTLEGPGSDGTTWKIEGTRAGRAARVELDHMHGVFGIACEIADSPVALLRIIDDRSIFAVGDSPYITDKLKVHTRWDEKALWELLPDTTRHTLVDMLGSPSASFTLDKHEVSMLLGPLGMMREPDAADVIMRQLDRLIAIAPVLEDYWNVDPRTIGAGRSTHVPRPRAAPKTQPPEPVVLREAADVAACALPARDALLARVAAERIEPFPAADPIRDGGDVKGRVVVLPPVPRSRWVKDFLKDTIVGGDAERGWYFARADDPGFARVLRAVERYERATRTRLDDAPYEIVARITGDPMMVVVDKQARTGHKLAVLGAMVGDRVFVDATAVDGDESRFAGERD